MADSLLFKIASDLDAKGFSDAAAAVRKVDKGQKAAGEQAEKHKKKVDGLKVAYQALLGLGIVAFFKSAVDEAVKVERSQFLLGQRVENTGKKWVDLKGRVLEYNAAMSQMTGVAEDEINDALSRLVDSMGDVGKAQEFLGATLGLARAQGLSYATAAEQVGRASLGVAEFTKTLAERIGITGEKSKDAEFVLATLQKRFGTLAQEEDTAAKNFAQFNNEMKKWREEIGTGIIPAVQKFMGWLRRLARAGDAVIDGMSVGFAMLSTRATGAFEIIKQAAQGNFKAAQVAMNTMISTLKELEKEGDAASAALKAAFTEPLDAIDKLPDALARGVKEMQPLTATFLKMQAEFRAAQAEGDAARLEQLLMALEQEKEVRAKLVADQMAAEGFSREQINAMIIESDAALNKDREKLAAQFLAKRTAMFFQAGQIVGVATAKSLQGDVTAWKQASIQIIDVIAQQAQAAIMANAIQGASKEVATKGIVGIATGAAAIAWGVAQSAAVAGLAQAAKGAIGATGGGGGAGAAPAAAGPAAQPTAQAAAPAAVEQQQMLIVNVTGDFIGEPEFIDRLGQRITERVENNDLRMVASAVTPQ